jgi:hypothetical protein
MSMGDQTAIGRSGLLLNMDLLHIQSGRVL